MRLDKFLADMGAGRRSELKKDIRKGCVRVDGETVKDPGFSVTETSDVCYRGRTVRYEKFSYYMLNKPAGVISATSDRSQKTVLDLLDHAGRKDIFPVGRLDKDTEGLLLLTNDGELAHRLLSPKHHVDKVYYARIAGQVSEEDVRRFSEGIRLEEDFVTLPARLVILSAGPESEVEVTIHEGKFHQIKRMFHAVGKEVIYLKRLSMGSLKLDDALAPGEYRRLTETEISRLQKGSE